MLLQMREKIQLNQDKIEIVTESGCHIWMGKLRPDGYGVVSRVEDGKKKYYRVHRVAYAAANGDIQDGLLVCHSCDIRSCVNQDHLFLGTHKDNTHDMMDKGRGIWPGPITPIRKLSPAEHSEIRTTYSKGKHKQSELAKLYGVHQSHISRIVRA